jgi:flagellar motility protein MotE (MotC chaperone)
MAFLKSKLFAAILGGLLFMLTTAFLIPQGIGPAGAGDGEHGRRPKHPANVRGPSWTFFNPELEQIIAELKMEKETMATKQRQLADWETRLKAERAELDEAAKRIGRIEQVINRDLIRIKEDEAVNLKRLAKMYAAMDPAGAAKILNALDDDVAVKILTLMKEAETALILEAMAKMGEAETKRAAKLSENLRLAVPQKSAAKP